MDGEFHGNDRNKYADRGGDGEMESNKKQVHFMNYAFRW